MKNGKRILSVTVKTMVDESPDTSSWLGEYSRNATSEFSIDRKHSLDCPQQMYNSPTEAIDILERAIAHLENVKCGLANVNETDSYKAHAELGAADVEDAQNLLIETQEELADNCCGERGDMECNQYRYFNPSFNYVDKAGKALPENTREDVIKYTRQDYERLESFNRGDWCYIGIKVDAEILLPSGIPMALVADQTIVQTITSGGLWGIESDSGKSHIVEIEKEELSELRRQLSIIGFSKRAISIAFKNVQRSGRH